MFGDDPPVTDMFLRKNVHRESFPKRSAESPLEAVDGESSANLQLWAGRNPVLLVSRGVSLVLGHCSDKRAASAAQPLHGRRLAGIFVHF